MRRQHAIGLERLAGILLGPGQHLLTHQTEEAFGRPFRRAGLDAPRPAGARQRVGGGEHGIQMPLGRLVVADEIADTFPEAAPAPACRFRSPEPAPELRRLERGQMAGKGRIRGVEEMMTLVEDEPAQILRCGLLFFRLCIADGLIDRRLAQDERMSRDRKSVV